MAHDTIEYDVAGKTFAAHVEWDDATEHARPAVLVLHAWAGQGETERRWARELAELGYVGVALDVYGKGVLGSSKEENQALMGPLMGDRDQLLARLSAGLEAAKGHAAVDAERVAAIGFCFGGLCALDMARGGLDVRGVVSFHGLFHPRPTPASKIDAKVLACHGYDDPMAKPDQLVAFAKEMTEAGADWQVHAYGHTMHAFTNPDANDPGFGTVYSPDAARRSRQAMEAFLAEVLG